jgi:hypothetical protein
MLLNEISSADKKILHNTDWKLPDAIINFLHRKKYELLGAGAFSVAFKSDNNSVLKVSYYNDRAWLHFAGEAMKTSNKFFPKIRMIKQFETIPSSKTKYMSSDVLYSNTPLSDISGDLCIGDECTIEDRIQAFQHKGGKKQSFFISEIEALKDIYEANIHDEKILNDNAALIYGFGLLKGGRLYTGDLYDALFRTNTISNTDDLSVKLPIIGKKQYARNKQVQEAISILANILKQHPMCVDLHPGNIMCRKNGQYVITDPFANYGIRKW